MEDEDSFTEVVSNLKGLSRKSRDPRSIRVSTVISALTDVVEGEISPAKVYASTVTTLEGTLHKDHAGDVDVIFDSLTTQAALLKILGVVVPHVSPATLGATIGLTSRVLRGAVSSSLSILGSQEGAATNMLLETNDGLGALSTVLCDTCQAVGEVLRHLPLSTTHESVIKQLLMGTLIGLLQDTRQKVQSAAKDALNGLLLMGSPRCHPAILKTTTKYVNMHIDNYLKNPTKQTEIQDLIELTGFLGRSLISLDFTSIGGRLMTILVDLLNEESSSSSPARPVFVANSHGSTLKILTMNSVLSAILSLLEADDEIGMKKSEKVDSFASRVLASLVQSRPTLVFREGAAEIDLLESGRTIYGEILISSTQRVLNNKSKAEIGAKLLPMVLQQLLGLSQPVEADGSEGNDVAETLFAEVSQLCRVQLQALSRNSPALHKSTSQNCLRVLKSVVTSNNGPFDETYTPVLQCLALLLQQMTPQGEEETQCIQSLIVLRCDDSIDKNLQRQIEDALNSLIQGIGLEKFWNVIDFPKMCSKNSLKAVPNKYAWLIEVMKVSGLVISDSQLHLSFFQEQVLPLARQFDALFVKGSTAGNAVFRSQVINLWTLFPVFCRAPVDLDDAFSKLAPILIKAMSDERYPEFVTAICNGLDTLAKGVHDRKNELKELIDGEEGSQVRLEAEAMEQISMKLLPSLFKLVDSLHDTGSESSKKSEADEDNMETEDVVKDSTGVLVVTRCIASIAKVAPNAQIQRLFTKVVQKMLESSQSNDKKTIEKMCSLLALSQALVISECLNDSSISLLYRSLKPIIRTDETPSKIQKRAYKVMAEICKRYHSFVAEPERLKEVMELLSSTSATSQVSARFMRLRCMTFVVDGFENSALAARQKITSSLVGETLLCLKDYNAKTRDAAYKLLISLQVIHGNSAEFIQMIAAAVGSNTSHMRSAAVTALSRLVFQLSSDDIDVQNLIPALLKTVLILSDDPSREVTKSMVVFVRVSVTAASAEQLEPLLPDILNGLLKYHRGKDRFREKIKIIIKKLVKYFGYEKLMPFVPPSDSRLLTHMRKLSEREKRRKLTRRNLQREETRDFQAMEDSDEEDSDDGKTLMTGMTGLTKMSRMSRISRMSSGKTLKRRHMETSSLAHSTRSGRVRTTMRIKSDADGNVTDVKDLKNVRFAEMQEDGSDAEGDMEFDSSGKLVVRDMDDELEHNDDGGTVYSFKSRRSTADRSTLDRSISKDSTRKKNTARPGSAYKTKKAGGDTKKKGQKFEPYAYMQLDGRNYSKKNRRHAVEQMGSVVQRRNKRQKK
uniref:RRP12 HEAT domain-containing protein n=1 Tax=Pseudo-nitzschia australis TaxID=44445 RepID=A0A7S4EQ48_9STRA|mmetsp:Transcript_14672/g.30513  ORF Transcript_14672/g.30513 Transcript_14672/m.30513 type:complete len:1300 (+) Transcript_14672:200-4099(+)|eukprot:CAMPEP_0168233304 /NCGR_PEP_ID=MMETSP0140_2-20121125/17645_1 /TAXON_ID=44445 /ORGANISM="Pseudo-nitzschia australis, Strain 10249 10 AB" /LENGTH=1299 /DNA_ID=CAMNT_0008165989 /DNA_START=95 /DNA_END=3994 /DNA_ORIENTATION=-